MIKRIPGAFALLIFLAFAAQASAQDSAQPAESEQGAQATEQETQSRQNQAQDDERRGPRVYPTLAAGLIKMGVPVIDVRSEAEIEETGTLADATHIPHTEVDAIAEFIGDDSGRAVVMYCGSGRRVGMVIDTLRERGYHGMVNAGGYEDLRQAMESENEE